MKQVMFRYSLLFAFLLLAGCKAPTVLPPVGGVAGSPPASGLPERDLQAPIFASDESIREEVYKTVGEVSLRLWIISPGPHRAADNRAIGTRPAMVFFFGGGWLSGSPVQFERQARVLSTRGMVSILVDYRVLGRHGTMAEVAVEDAKSAIRWVRQNAHRLGIDPARIGAAGGSAGGHLAAAALVPGFDAANEDTQVSCAPDALVLFNPALMIAPVAGVFEPPASLDSRIGVEFTRICPYYNLAAPLPPTLIMHGTGDLIVPIATVQMYCERANSLGGACTLVPYEGAPHTFFNADPYYAETLANMVDFLEQLGWLTAE
jgi:acetyl esterase